MTPCTGGLQLTSRSEWWRTWTGSRTGCQTENKQLRSREKRQSLSAWMLMSPKALSLAQSYSCTRSTTFPQGLGQRYTYLQMTLLSTLLSSCGRTQTPYRKTLMNCPHGRTDGTIAYLVIVLPKDTETLQEDLNELATWEDRWHYCLPCYRPAEGHRDSTGRPQWTVHMGGQMALLPTLLSSCRRTQRLYRKTSMNWPHGRTDGTIAYLVIILPKDTETLQEDLNELSTWEDRWHYCLPCYHPAEGHRDSTGRPQWTGHMGGQMALLPTLLSSCRRTQRLYRKTSMNWPHGRTDGTIAYLVIILPKDTETLQEDLNELATWEDRWHYCLPCYHPAEGHRDFTGRPQWTGHMGGQMALLPALLSSCRRTQRLYRKTSMNWPHGRTDGTIAYLVIILLKDTETLQEDLNELATCEDRWHYCLPCYHPAEGHRDFTGRPQWTGHMGGQKALLSTLLSSCRRT